MNYYTFAHCGLSHQFPIGTTIRRQMDRGFVSNCVYLVWARYGLAIDWTLLRLIDQFGSKGKK